MQELGTVMKSIGQDPTQEELVKIISGVDKDGMSIGKYIQFHMTSGKRQWRN